jgi:hypothetical protein
VQALWAVQSGLSRRSGFVWGQDSLDGATIPKKFTLQEIHIRFTGLFGPSSRIT